ncbi:MAG: site-specific integrase [Chloroflexi bacterium]|nr:site-specific integrase [Chloroflexota bacterium]
MVKSTGPKAPRRANGEGRVYPTAEGRWRGALWWTDAGGGRRRKVVSATTQAAAKRALAKARIDLDAGRAPLPAGTVATFLEAWLDASRQRIRPSTWRQYELSTRLYLVPRLGRTALAKLSPADVEAMTQWVITGGRAPRTAALARVVLRRALQDAVRDGLVHRNVAALARPPHVPVHSLAAGVDYLEPEQLRRLLAGAKVHRLGPLVTLAAATGLRQGELLGLWWSDVDEAAGTLTVRRSLAVAWRARREAGEKAFTWSFAEPKTARSRRTIHLADAAIAALGRQRELQAVERVAAGSAWADDVGLVFADAVGAPLHGHQVTAAFHRLLEASGLPAIPFHGLRHSAATALLAAGVAIKVVSEQLGHSTITITADRYAGVVAGQRREAAEAMDRALGGTS